MKKNFRSNSTSPKKSDAPKRQVSTLFKKQRVAYKPHIEKQTPDDDNDMRLNKYVALCGIASRRAAADLIKEGHVTVNGVVNKEIGYRIMPKDVVAYKGKEIKPSAKKIYILMNKPKDTITTVSDEKGRKTVMDLVRRTIKERIYPVGRLDRDTTGLLLLTNDGELAQKLSHPSFKVKKLYHAVLDKPVTKEDMRRIAEGIELEDGKAIVDAVNYVEKAGKDEVMIEIHIGKNRIVRRIFEHLGYEVMKLDRVYYGGLTKKDLPRSGYRSLTEGEIVMLKHFLGQ
jgi:23S rRNA pseudouridine2605 synthase